MTAEVSQLCVWCSAEHPVSSVHAFMHSFTRSFVRLFVHQLFRELPLLAGGGRTDSLCSPGSDSSASGGSSGSLSPVFRPPHAPTFPEAPFCLSSRPDLHAHCPLHLESAALLAHWPLFLLPPRTGVHVSGLLLPEDVSW